MESALDERFSIEDLLDVPILEEVLNAYGLCFGIGVTILDYHGKEVTSYCPAHGACDVNSAGEVAAKCDEVKRKLATHPLEETQVLQIKAFCGMRYSLFTLTQQLEVLGRVIVGPFRDDKITNDTILESLKSSLGDDVPTEWIDRTPAFSQDQLKSIIRLLAKTLDAILFVNAKRLVTTRIHLESLYSEREKIFAEVEKQDSGSEEDRAEIERLKELF